ncbi:hypothetical protein ABZ721_10360 [Streptomyces sp. NPDC006733]|uniref:hypothetical protein n=1 Tax=Streptomyces sp. NPDC006733 TaxID=3155460 RepID=UPI0034075D28
MRRARTGIRATCRTDPANSDYPYSGCAGDQFWILTSRVDDGSFYPDYTGYHITWNADPTNPSRTTTVILAAHAKAMAASS